jgi:putative membrane protein
MLAMTLLARRALVLGFAAAGSVLGTRAAFAVDALPDARFVGYSQQVNDFEIAAGRMALAKSTNENVRAFASRAVALHTDAAQRLSKARSEAGVSYAPDPSSPPNAQAILQRLNGLDGAAFDTAYANAQLGVCTDAEAQYGAYSQNGRNGALRRYAQAELPNMQGQLEFARRLAGGR